MYAPIDTNTIAADPSGSWATQTLTSLNGVGLRFRGMRNATAAFHAYETSPECFFVLLGTVIIDTTEGSVALTPGQFHRVEPGVTHRARVDGTATLLVLDALDA